MSTPTDHVLDDVAAERAAQTAKWGEQNHPDGTNAREYGEARDFYRMQCDISAERKETTWRHILLEETYEAFAESDPVKLRRELVQVAAVVVAWIESIDRRAV